MLLAKHKEKALNHTTKISAKLIPEIVYFFAANKWTKLYFSYFDSSTSTNFQADRCSVRQQNSFKTSIFSKLEPKATNGVNASKWEQSLTVLKKRERIKAFIMSFLTTRKINAAN